MINYNYKYMPTSSYISNIPSSNKQDTAVYTNLRTKPLKHKKKAANM